MRGSSGGGASLSFEAIVNQVRNLKQLGVCLWKLIFASGKGPEEGSNPGTVTAACRWWEKFSRDHRVFRVSRALFPLGTKWESTLRGFPLDISVEEILVDPQVCASFGDACWCELVVLFLNHLYNGTLGFGPQETSKAQLDVLDSIEMSVKRWLIEDCNFEWSREDVIADLNRKVISYTGEEQCKAEPLSAFRVAPALPPEGHGGSIDCSSWISGKSKWYLENPKACLLPDTGQALPKLQARVHVVDGEEKMLAELLVRRSICRWVPEEKVLRYRGQKVLNGLFGVPKSTVLSNGQTSLRCIMNLIPSNSILRSIPGRIGKLPGVTQWLNVCLGEDETMSLCQSDMVSAFYLFRIPQQWTEMLCFDLSAMGEDLGMGTADSGKRFYLGCQVLPMGWASAVGVMQQIAEEVLHRGGIPSTHQVVRGKPMPSWMVDVTAESERSGRIWWHVYLDNYASGEKLKPGGQAQGGTMQKKVEELWESAGILSSKGKAVSDADKATELGAFIGGAGKWIGAGAERMLKLAKLTLWLADRRTLAKKSVQIAMGRWVFAMQFRRPFMSHFEAVWKSLGGAGTGRKKLRQVKMEFLLAVMGMPLLHTWMGARVDSETTCSDASMSGGAVAVARNLTPDGQAFVASQRAEAVAEEIPVVLVSLFNGIGGANRSYDVAGVRLKGIVIADIHKSANRVFSRRWPGAHIFRDVKELTREILEETLMGMEPFEEIHFWAGFPCVDLSSVRAGRLNLEGEGSGLIFEALRIYELLKEIFPKNRIRFVFENVASMDVSARDEISSLLGVKPYRLDPVLQAPLSRPRFCWTDVDVYQVEGVNLTDKGGYLELEVEGEWPAAEAWLDEETEETNPGITYPTCMKAIRRERPPPCPAGISRTPELARRRWETEDYRFPPYQYKDCYMLFDHRVGSCRLLNSLERERLMGYGSFHTYLAMSASEAKTHKQGLEDLRCSLIGDSFSIFSFMVIAAYAAAPWTGQVPIAQMNRRVGMPPGFSMHIDFTWPLGQTMPPSQLNRQKEGVEEINKVLLCRTNHTGSDVRVVSGQLMNEKTYPRESVRSCWWKWSPVFQVHWSLSEHINALEIRGIYLSLLWKARNLRLCNRKLFHITDSYVAMSILAKGRTSSFALQGIVRKIAALLLGGSSHLILGHVESADNPTDEGSRRTTQSTSAQKKRTHRIGR